jgi:hypothetical protein
MSDSSHFDGRPGSQEMNGEMRAACPGGRREHALEVNRLNDSPDHGVAEDTTVGVGAPDAEA